MKQWKQEWIRRWKDEGLSEDEFPWDELPKVNEDSLNWEVSRVWRRTARENQIKDSRIWIKAPPGTIVRIEYEYGEGQAFDRPNILGKVDKYGSMWWYNAKRTPGHMSVEVDGEVLVEGIRFDLGYEYAGIKIGSWNANNRPGQYVYDIEVTKKKW